MQPSAAPQADPTADGVPPIVPDAPWRLRTVEVASGARLRVEFVDGSAGEVHMTAFLASAAVEGTPFETLRKPAFFGKARVVLGAVQWPNGADLAPDTMYDAIHEYGLWVVE